MARRRNHEVDLYWQLLDLKTAGHDQSTVYSNLLDEYAELVHENNLLGVWDRVGGRKYCDESLDDV